MEQQCFQQQLLQPAGPQALRPDFFHCVSSLRAAVFDDVLSLPLGALGLLFAVLAYRKGRKTSNICVTGITLSCIGLAAAAALIVYSFVMLPALMRNDVFRRQINAVSQQMYGMDFDAFLEEYYGYSFED